MCGLTGFKTASASDMNFDRVANAMADQIAHRGPDDSGVWVDHDSSIALAHRRLSILDLSPAGHQPMHSASGRYVLVFNGEVYNHLDLRKQLLSEGEISWRGHSDTETLLACIEAWGLERALQASVGMFAMAVWDRRERVLQLARDRMGEKPLYYGWQGDTLLFGSELKALTVHPAFKRQVNRDALALLLRHNYIPAPYSIWQGISKLLPASVLTFHEGQRDPVLKSYWSFSEMAVSAEKSLLVSGMSDAADGLEQVLNQAVRGQMLADVPLGALLSGGVDSSMIVALMQKQSAQPVKTFCIGFNEKAFDESVHAAAVAHHLGTEHTELCLSGRDVLGMVPRMASLYDEPFADSSQLPTALVMSLARQKVAVALSGDGGDELFGGYNRYSSASRVWAVLRWLPFSLRMHLARFLTGISVEQWDRLAQPLTSAIKMAQLGNKLHKLGQRLSHVQSLDDLYATLLVEWNNAELVVPGSAAARTIISDRTSWPTVSDPTARMMAVDTLTYLPDDILVKVDRAAMAVSLETRAPFLDHRVVEFSLHLPMSMKISGRQGKVLLRNVLYRHVPQALIDRPKMGFGIPLDKWLRQDLRDWAEALLSREALSRDGFFDVDQVRDVWQQHLAGTASFGYKLWSVLMFQAWWQAQNEER